MKTNLKHVFLLLILIGFWSSCDSDKNENDPKVEPSLDRELMLNLVNDLRKSPCDCSGINMPAAQQLKWNSKLEAAALRHAKDMRDKKYFAHTSPDGASTVASRLSEQGYTNVMYGENIAHGQRSESDAFDSWKTSQGHCQNMMHISFTEIGIAHLERYWVMVLASPK